MIVAAKRELNNLLKRISRKIQKYVGTPQFQEKSKIALLMYL